MPTGTPKAGYRKTKWREAKSREEIEREIAFRVPDILIELEKLTKPFACPHCGNTIKVIDKDVGMYLIDRVLGKPKQKLEMDVTETIQLTGDQCDALVERFKLAQGALLPEGDSLTLVDTLEGDYKEI